jgi:hypothetical protein
MSDFVADFPLTVSDSCLHSNLISDNRLKPVFLRTQDMVKNTLSQDSRGNYKRDLGRTQDGKQYRLLIASRSINDLT